MNKSFRQPTILAGASVSVLALSGLILASPSSSASTSQTITLNLNVASVCTLSVNTLSHTATIDPGTSGQLGSSTLTAICNDNDGLAVYAVGFSGDSLGNNTLISTTNSSNTIPSATASSPTTSQWNMTLAAVSGDYAPTITNQTTGDNPIGDFTNPHIIPTVYTKVAYRNSYTDAGTNATGANFTASFNAYVGATQTAGTYQGKVKFLLVHPNVLTYDAQTGQPATFAQDRLVSFDEAYAAAGKTKYNGYYKMQDMTASICSAVDIDTANGDLTGSLIDTRDNSVYSVSKLADGKCWMTKNLRLDFSSSVVADQNIEDLEATTNSPASGFWTTAKATLASNANFNSSNLNNIKYSTINIGDNTEDSFGHTYDDYGVYYNWYAATAGNGTSSTEATDTDGDICPYGWRLPTGGFSKDFNVLNSAINSGSQSSSSGLTSSPANFVYSGHFSNEMAYNTGVERRGAAGEYWSRTAYGDISFANAAYCFDFSSSYTGRGTGAIAKYYGFPVRCLAGTT